MRKAKLCHSRASESALPGARGIPDPGPFARQTNRCARVTPILWLSAFLLAATLAHAAPYVSPSTPNTGPAPTQDDSLIPRYLAPGAGDWERWKMNCLLDGSCGEALSPLLSPQTVLPGSGAGINLVTYGAKCDARQGTDGTTAIGSTTFSSPSANFTSADYGKIIDPSYSGVPLGTTIAAILGSTSVQMTHAATAAWTGNNFWTVGTDNTNAINSALAAVPTTGTGGAAVYTPATAPGMTSWTGRCLIENGVTVAHQGTFLTGDGPYVSIWQCETTATNDCVTFSGFTYTPVGVSNMGIIADAGGNSNVNCLTFSSDAGVYVDRNFFQGCLIGLNVNGCSDFLVRGNISELSQVNYEFQGASGPGEVIGNDSFHQNNGGKGFFFDNVSTSAHQKIVATSNFDTGTTGNTPGAGSGLYIYGSNDLDLGTFVSNYSNVVAGPLTISNSARVRLRPVMHGNLGPLSLLIDSGCSDIQLLDPDIDNSFTAASTTLSSSMASGDTSMSVVSTVDFPTPNQGTLFVDSEQILYTGATSTTFTGLTRGANGTTAASHSSGATVTSNAQKLFLPLGANNAAARDAVTIGFLGQNLVPGSIIGWPTQDSNQPLTPAAGQFGDPAFVYTGTGSTGPITLTQSANIPVTTGEVVTFGGYIDATNVTAGLAEWCITSGLGNPLLLCESQTAGAKGRIATNYVIPSGVSNLAISSYLNSPTVANGKTLTFSSPEVLSGWYPLAYSPPSASACFGPVTLSSGSGAFSNACVNSGSHCVANDQTAANAVKVAAPSAGSVAITGTGADHVMVVCQ
jgi:hypothetical protein